MFCLCKLFCSILNLRLTQYVMEKNILKSEQLGFVVGNRTSDAHIILHILIQSYCIKKGRNIFACFVDFKKAFDSLPRKSLFEKLLGHGITGKFFNNLKMLYTNDNCCIKVGVGVGPRFIANRGVKQGCVLSPLIFNIFFVRLAI